MKSDQMDETFQRMDSKGFFRLEIPEKLNMARLIIDYWAQHGRGQIIDAAERSDGRQMFGLDQGDLPFAARPCGIVIPVEPAVRYGMLSSKTDASSSLISIFLTE